VSVKSSNSGSILSGISIKQFNNTAMKILKTHFRKNDLYYSLIHRNDKLALYETRQEEDSDLCHYEVARIYIRPAHSAVGVDFEEAEVLTSNDDFGNDGSGSFITRDSAMKHFLKLSATLTAVQVKQTRMSKQPYPFITEPSGIG
jgi:hypothetical protein